MATQASAGDITVGPAAWDVSGLITERSASLKDPSKSPAAFGTAFTDHMASVPWTRDAGWGKPRIHPLENLQLHPACSALHYGCQAFEGMKAYKDQNSQIRLFRPDLNMKRLNRSAARLHMPTFDEASALQLLAKFVACEENFVPAQRGQALYLRPTLISTDPSLAVFPPSSALLYILASPVGSFYATGTKAIALEANTQYARAWPGGVGDMKVGGNYAPCFRPQMEAAAKGFQQNLWLNASNGDEYLSEVGTMNLFVLLQPPGSATLELVTPPLDGTVLPGVTRASVLELARARLPSERYAVAERPITMREVAAAADAGRLKEVFGSGTAVVIAPVRSIGWRGRTVDCGLQEGEEQGEVARLMRGWIEEIQYGEVEHEWSYVVE